MYQTARLNMAENQLRPSKIQHSGVLDAMSSIPREAFLPARLKAIAYHDAEIKINADQWLIEPLALARMLQEAEPAIDGVGLISGCTTGYCAAVFARLVATCFFIVPDEEAKESFEALFEQLEIDNILVETGSALDGLNEQAPFDTIMIIGETEKPPAALFEQLENNGRLVSVQNRQSQGRITVFEKIEDSTGYREISDCAMSPLRLPRKEPVFEF